MMPRILPSLLLIIICLTALLPRFARADAVSDEQVAIAAQRSGDTDSSLQLFTAALVAFREEGLYLDAARVAQALMMLQIGLGDIEAAVTVSVEGRRMLMLAGKPERAALAASQLGSVLKARSEYERAEQCYLDALEIYQALGNAYAEAGTLMSLGVLAELLQQPARSADYYSSAGEEYLQLGDERGVMQSYASSGQAQLNAGNPAAAEDAFRQALFLCGKLDEARACAQQQLGLSRALRALQNLDEALASMDACLQLLEGAPDATLQASAHLERGRILRQKNEGKKALLELSRAWEMFASNGQVNEQSEMAAELIEVARLAGRRDLAEQYRLELLELNVSF
jgi:tetratricopeptide (TPR) repeat protein